jgi:TAP-like protein
VQQQAAREGAANAARRGDRQSDAAAGVCEAFGVSRVSALLISGTGDPRTPPDRAEATRKGLAASERVVVQNGGHELLPVREMQARCRVPGWQARSRRDLAAAAPDPDGRGVAHASAPAGQ